MLVNVGRLKNSSIIFQKEPIDLPLFNLVIMEQNIFIFFPLYNLHFLTSFLTGYYS